MILNKAKLAEEEFRKQTAVFGGGCFWCLDAVFRRVNGVLSVVSGYAGGRTENPVYEKVSRGSTGHAEVVRIEYDPARLTYRKLLEIFFEIHDPTSLNRQGLDVGEQYRSIILYADDAQKLTAEVYVKELKEKRVYEKSVITEIAPLEKFYKAENYHQNYYAKHQEGAYCRMVILPKLEKIRKY